MKRIVILAALVLTTLTGFSQTSPSTVPSFDYYPAPAVNYITLKSYYQPIHEIEIYNMNGQLVYHSTTLNCQFEYMIFYSEPIEYIPTYKVQIDISNLSSGQYIVRVDRCASFKEIIMK